MGCCKSDSRAGKDEYGEQKLYAQDPDHEKRKRSKKQVLDDHVEKKVAF